MKGLQNFSSILGIKQQQQNLQTGQYQQATAQAESQQAQQKNLELQDAQQMALSVKSGGYRDAQGNFDRQKLADDIATRGPYAQQMSSSLLSQANEIVTNQKMHQDLSGEQQGRMGAALGGLATKKDVSNTDFVDTMDGLVEQGVVPRRMAMSMLTHLPPQASPDQLRELARRWSISATSPESATEQTTPKPVTFQGAGGVQVGNVNPQAVGGAGPVGGPPMRNAISPQTWTDAAGGLHVLGPGGGGGGGQKPPAQPGAIDVMHPKPGQMANAVASGTNDESRYNEISKEGVNAQTGLQLSRQVEQLADAVHTGKYTKEMADNMAVLRQHNPGITDRQILQKMTAQLKTMAESNAATDQSKSQIEQGMPSPETMEPPAVKEAARYVGGIFAMRGDRQAHADKYKDTNGSSVGVRGADDAFMRAADPLVYQYKNLPANERREFLGKKFQSPDQVREFVGRVNQIKHYGGS
jgi:hypothetical protein